MDRLCDTCIKASVCKYREMYASRCKIVIKQNDITEQDGTIQVIVKCSEYKMSDRYACNSTTAKSDYY